MTSIRCPACHDLFIPDHDVVPKHFLDSPDGACPGSGAAAPVLDDEPPPPAVGREGRWEKLGSIGVDSASIGITDLLVGVEGSGLTNVGATDSHYAVPGSQFAGDWGTGIRFWAGFGDGGYDVWGWIVDYGVGDEVDERVAQIVCTMIDEADLADWRER